jgi:hypothetical protein
MKCIEKIVTILSRKKEKQSSKPRKKAKSYAEMKKIRDELKNDLRRRG